MSIELADIPSGFTPPTGTGKSDARRALIKKNFGRRDLLKAGAVSTVALSFGVLDLIPKLAPRASAAPTTWTACGQYQTTNTHWGECNPFASSGTVKISNGYCNGNDYHRVDTVAVMGGYYEYYRRQASCDNKNAWVWRISNNPTTPNYRDRRCSDGRYVLKDSGGVVRGRNDTCCEHLLPVTGSPVTPDTA